MNSIRGRRVLVTRAQEDAQAWASRLEELGATPVVLPCIECVLEDDPGVARRLAEDLSGADWLLLCSRRAVQAVSALLETAGSKLPEHARVAVVGPATARAARDELGRVDLQARGGTSAALCDEVELLLSPGQVVVAALTEISDSRIETRLSAAGARVKRIDVYRSGPVSLQTGRRSLHDLGVDLALLASPSAVTGLLNQAEVPASFPVLSIGPSTTTAARSAGLNVVAEASERGLDSMLEALKETP